MESENNAVEKQMNSESENENTIEITVNVLSATEAHVFSKGFRKGKRSSHFRKHGNDYQGITEHEYEAIALELIQSKVGDDIYGYITETGIVRYDARTRDFVSGHPNDGVFTMMKLRNGMERFEYLKSRDEKLN